jgi:hypothetical protein
LECAESAPIDADADRARLVAAVAVARASRDRPGTVGRTRPTDTSLGGRARCTIDVHSAARYPTPRPSGRGGPRSRAGTDRFDGTVAGGQPTPFPPALETVRTDGAQYLRRETRRRQGLAAREADRAALADLLRRSPHVRRVVAGHVHRTSTTLLGGCPVVTCTGTNWQATLDLRATDSAVTHEPPSLLVHALVAGELVTHVQPI